MTGDRDAVEAVRIRLDITGVVQGVGFRPTVARIAARHGVTGFVYNDAGAVRCEMQGAEAAVAAAVAAIRDDGPPLARVDDVRIAVVEPIPGDVGGFRIGESRSVTTARTLVPPDVATCADCLRELRDPADRRFGHPFITCTNCGPRFTVITALPYDRPGTTMAGFPMCAACTAEYTDPTNRRWHAQTIACPDCGPRLSWRGPGDTRDPMACAVGALRAGGVVAVKGIGGYHLACRADDAVAVDRLRRRKGRPAKPFAVMVADLDAARAVVEVTDAAAAALTSPAAPIVLAPRTGRGVAAGVAPRLLDLGVLLAYSPVHHLLFDRLGRMPLVLTSANAGGSPIVHRDDDLSWIDDVVDGVLSHDRPIHVPCEDSVCSVTPAGIRPVRRSRGYAPLPVAVPRADGPVILATGGDVKTTLALLGSDGHAHVSAHLGDMADPRTQAAFDHALEHLAHLTDRRAEVIACDAHPGYATTAWARRRGLRSVPVQHHHAHAVTLLADHGRIGTPLLAVAYDGAGYGADATIWGGELLAVPDTDRCIRVGHLAPFALPGGDHATRRPARIALDLLYRTGIAWDLAPAPVAAVGRHGLRVLAQQIPRGLRCVPTTSMGRLFDAVASLLDVCQEVTYEGQAAIELEHVARTGTPATATLPVRAGVLHPGPLLSGLVDGLRSGAPVADLAATFHHAVIEATVTAATAAARATRMSTIGLTGGVFANELLTAGVRNGLQQNGFDVLTHRVLPCNDGGLAVGQAVIAAARLAAEGEGSRRCVSASPAG